MEHQMVSLNETIRETENLSLIDQIEDDKKINLGFEKVKNEQLRELLENYVNLTPKQKEVIYLKYGFYDGEYKTSTEVSKKLGNSKEASARLERSALEKLRNDIKIQELYDGIVRGKYNIFGKNKVKKLNKINF